MPELGPYGSVRGARGNSRPYRESHCGSIKLTQVTQSGYWHRLWLTSEPVFGIRLVAKAHLAIGPRPAQCGTECSPNNVK